MPAPKLLRYSGSSGATANTIVAVGPLVPAGRAFVVASVMVMNNAGGSSPVFDLYIGGVPVAFGVTLGPGDVYVERAAVAPAGEYPVQVRSTLANGVQVSVFGQEVDN